VLFVIHVMAMFALAAVTSLSAGAVMAPFYMVLLIRRKRARRQSRQAAEPVQK